MFLFWIFMQTARAKSKKKRFKKFKQRPRPRLPPPPLRLGAKADLYNRFDKAHGNIKNIVSIAKGGMRWSEATNISVFNCPLKYDVHVFIIVYTDYLQHTPFVNLNLAFTTNVGRSGETIYEEPIRQTMIRKYRVQSSIFDKSYLQVSRNVYHYFVV